MFRPLFAGMLMSCMIACGDKDTTADDDTGTDTGSDTLLGGNNNNNNNSPECSEDGVSPCIEEVEAWCYENTVGNSAFFWQVTVDADDPQGDDTIEEGSVTVTKDGSTVHEALIVCDGSDCFGTWNASSTNPTMTCSESSAGQYTFKVVVVDEDGNASDGATTVGYLGYQ